MRSQKTAESIKSKGKQILFFTLITLLFFSNKHSLSTCKKNKTKKTKQNKKKQTKNIDKYSYSTASLDYLKRLSVFWNLTCWYSRVEDVFVEKRADDVLMHCLSNGMRQELIGDTYATELN